MTLTILDDSMSSDRSPHTARLAPERSTYGKSPGYPDINWAATRPSPP